jgi:hypothetical protein
MTGSEHEIDLGAVTDTNLEATVKEQAAQIQKVSAQLEVSKSTPQLVQKNQ